MPERNGRRRGRAGVLVVLVALLLAACSTAPPPQVPTSPFEDTAGPVRTDREPIAARFPGLSGFVTAHWVTGRAGTSERSASRSSDTFLQAVVVVPFEVHTRLMNTSTLGRSDPPTDVVSNLAALLPDGDGWMSTEYPNAGERGWRTRLWIRPDSLVVYVSSQTG